MCLHIDLSLIPLILVFFFFLKQSLKKPGYLFYRISKSQNIEGCIFMVPFDLFLCLFYFLYIGSQINQLIKLFIYAIIGKPTSQVLLIIPSANTYIYVYLFILAAIGNYESNHWPIKGCSLQYSNFNISSFTR